ncbi:hypothetical protein KY318_00435 [Candidatus Woesearchaeota archaeon]|nr:hypothetical protein [Candidatus Woesearchaeota archaeon]
MTFLSKSELEELVEKLQRHWRAKTPFYCVVGENQPEFHWKKPRVRVPGFKIKIYWQSDYDGCIAQVPRCPYYRDENSWEGSKKSTIWHGNGFCANFGGRKVMFDSEKARDVPAPPDFSIVFVECPLSSVLMKIWRESGLTFGRSNAENWNGCVYNKRYAILINE